MSVAANSTVVRWMRGIRRRSGPLNAWQRFCRKTVRSQPVAFASEPGANAYQQKCGLILQLCICLGALLALAGLAHSEPTTGENTPNQLVPGKILTDLEGTKIQIKLVTEMLIQREGGPKFPVTSQADWIVTVESEAKIGWSFQPTVHSPRGDQVGLKIASTATLDKPWYTANGEAIWQLTEGALIFVRSFKNGGAMRMSIGFKQDGPNLTCVANLVYARERDKNSLTMNSAIDGVPFTAFSWKPVSSSCDVRR
jgi:hypothetical protein